MMTVVDMAVMSAGSCRYEDTDAHDDVGVSKDGDEGLGGLAPKP